MSFLDSILGSALGGGNIANSPLRPVLADILGGLASGSGHPGIGGLIERFGQAGHGDVANSWVSNGPNQPIDPGALHQVFGQDQVNQWSQQTGLAPHDLLNQLSQFLPHAVNQMTPDGRVPEPAQPDQAGSAFDGPGMP